MRTGSLTVSLSASSSGLFPSAGVLVALGRSDFSAATDSVGDAEAFGIETPSGGAFKCFWLGPGEIARTVSPRILRDRGVAEGVSSDEAVSAGLGVAEGDGEGLGFELGNGFAEGLGDGEAFELFLCFGDGEREAIECFRGRGVGVGVAKSFFIF